MVHVILVLIEFWRHKKRKLHWSGQIYYLRGDGKHLLVWTKVTSFFPFLYCHRYITPYELIHVIYMLIQIQEFINLLRDFLLTIQVFVTGLFNYKIYWRWYIFYCGVEELKNTKHHGMKTFLLFDNDNTEHPLIWYWSYQTPSLTWLIP